MNSGHPYWVSNGIFFYINHKSIQMYRNDEEAYGNKFCSFWFQSDNGAHVHVIMLIFGLLVMHL